MFRYRQIDTKTKYRVIIAMYPICIIAFAAIGLLLFSEQELIDSFWHRTDLFYIRLVWFEVLFSAGWFAGIVEPVRYRLKYHRQIGGGCLATISAVINADILSIIVLLISIFFPRNSFYDYLPIIIQIAIFLFCIVKVFLLKYAQSYQVDRLNAIPANTKTQEQLIGMLTICEQQPIIIDKFSTTVKRIKMKIKTIIPETEEIALSENYKKLATTVESLYDKIMEGQYDSISSDLLQIERNIVETIGDCQN